MGGVIQLDVLGKGAGKYATAWCPVTGPQKVTGNITIEVDIEQLATDLAGSADWGIAGLQLLFCDDAFTKYWLFIGIYDTSAAPHGSGFYPYDPDTDTVGSLTWVEDATHQIDDSIKTYSSSGAIAKTTKTVTLNPCGAAIFNKSPLYLLYAMFHAPVGSAAGAKGWRGNFYRIKVTQ